MIYNQGEYGMNQMQGPNGNKISIAHFSWEYPPAIWGGLGTFASELTKKQTDFGHKVTVFAINDQNKLNTSEIIQGINIFRPKTIDLTPSLSIFSNNDLLSWGQHLHFFSNVYSYNIMSATTLVDSLVSQQKQHYDIIDGHDWLGILGGMLAKNALNLPLIFHVHSTEYGRSQGHGSRTISDIEKQGAETADGVITVSHAMKEELKSIGFPPSKIHVCWNGIDPEKYNPSLISDGARQQLRLSYGIQENEIMLFFIGRLVTVKGITELIDAMPDIVSEFPHVKLVVLGIGDLETCIKEKIKSYHLQDHVILKTEFIPEPDRILHYAASDIVILPSLYEPFGIVCTEAMSMAKPVVVGAKGISGMREQIIASGNEKCGIHINPYSPKDIAWGIKSLLSQPDQWHMMGENGRKRVYDAFTWDHVTARTLEIYNNFL